MSAFGPIPPPHNADFLYEWSLACSPPHVAAVGASARVRSPPAFLRDLNLGLQVLSVAHKAGAVLESAVIVWACRDYFFALDILLLY